MYGILLDPGHIPITARILQAKLKPKSNSGPKTKPNKQSKTNHTKPEMQTECCQPRLSLINIFNSKSSLGDIHHPKATSLNKLNQSKPMQNQPTHTKSGNVPQLNANNACLALGVAGKVLDMT